MELVGALPCTAPEQHCWQHQPSLHHQAQQLCHHPIALARAARMLARLHALNTLVAVSKTMPNGDVHRTAVIILLVTTLKTWHCMLQY